MIGICTWTSVSQFVYLVGRVDGVLGVTGALGVAGALGVTGALVDESVVDGCGPELGGIGEGIDGGV